MNNYGFFFFLSVITKNFGFESPQGNSEKNDTCDDLTVL